MKTRLDEMLRAMVPPLVVRDVNPFQLISAVDVNDVNFDSRLIVTCVCSFIACVNSNGDKYDNLAARLHRTSISAEINVICTINATSDGNAWVEVNYLWLVYQLHFHIRNKLHAFWSFYNHDELFLKNYNFIKSNMF